MVMEAPHELGDAGEGDHTAAVTDLRGQSSGIGLEALVEPLAHRLAREAGALHHVMDDARVGLAAKVIAVDVARRPVDVLESDGEGPASRAACNQDGPVDVEENGAHGAQRWAGRASERSRATMGGSRLISASTSAMVLQRPMVKQSEPSISCGAQPMARSTCDGVPVRWAHADPEEAATPHRSRSRSTLSALAPRRTRLTWWGRRPRREPVSRHSGSEARTVSTRWSRRAARRVGSPCAASARISSAATPRPTSAGRFSVPERYPPSCPPPRIWGEILSPGRTQSAPAP